MKEEGVHEGTIEQIQRLYAERLFTGKDVPVDEKGRIRIDDLEMRDDVQAKVAKLWEEATTETLPAIGDLPGYRSDFLSLFGFEIDNVDYQKEANELVEIEGLVD